MTETVMKKWLIPALLVLLLAMDAAQAAVAFRAAASARKDRIDGGGSISVNKPAGTASGDVLLATVATAYHDSSTVTAPAGWTLLHSSVQNSGDPTRLYTYYKVAGGSETGPYVWTFSGRNDGTVAVIAGFSGVDTAAPIDASAAQNTPSARTHTALSVTTTVADDMLVTVHEYGNSRNWTPPPGMTEAADLYSMSSTDDKPVSMELNYMTRPVAGATLTRTATAATDSDTGATHAIALKALTAGVALGDFNSYDSATLPSTAIDGLIKTKVAGTNTLDIVALDVAKTALLTSFTGTVKVELLDAAINTAALDGNRCRSDWTVIQTVSPNPTFVSNGRLTVSFTENNAYRDVRVRVTYPASGTPTKIGCSSDNFALRPAGFGGLTVRDADWQSAGTARMLNNVVASGGVVHKAGRPFRIDAVAQNAGGTGIAYGAAAGNYNGQLQAVLTGCLFVAGCTPDTLDVLGAASAWTAGAAAGSFYSETASYNDAGSFTLQLVDSTFAAVDAGDGTAADCSAAGRYACSATVDVGRFVPDHFALVDASATDPMVNPAIDSWLPLAAPQFLTFNLADAACNTAAPAPRRAFTYIGQAFGYVSVPQFTFKAMDAVDNSMHNYQGLLMKLSPSAVTQTYSAASGTLDPALLPGTPVLTLKANYTNGNGSPVVGTIAVHAADTLAFVRSTPVAPFNAAIDLSITLQDSSENAVAGNGNITAAAPVVFSAIGFDAGSLMRFGRLKLSNAHGSELLNLPIPMEAQFWNGTVFATNALDNCTAVSRNNVALGNHRKGLTAINMDALHIPLVTALLSGRGSLKLSKPAPAAGGSVDVALNLGTVGQDNSCLSPAVAASSGAGFGHLQGKWCGASQNRDPSARATFGAYKNANEFIYMREMY